MKCILFFNRNFNSACFSKLREVLQKFGIDKTRILLSCLMLYNKDDVSTFRNFYDTASLTKSILQQSLISKTETRAKERLF